MSNLQKLIENGGLVINPRANYNTKEGDVILIDDEKEKLAKIVEEIGIALEIISNGNVLGGAEDYAKNALQQAEKIAGGDNNDNF